MTERMDQDPATAGPDGNGSGSLARESRVGQLVNFAATVAALALAGWLADLDLSTVPGWLLGAATAAVGTLVGTLTAWATANQGTHHRLPF